MREQSDLPLGNPLLLTMIIQSNNGSVLSVSSHFENMIALIQVKLGMFVFPVCGVLEKGNAECLIKVQRA